MAAPPVPAQTDPRQALAMLIGTAITKTLWGMLPEVEQAIGVNGAERAGLEIAIDFVRHESGAVRVNVTYNKLIAIPTFSTGAGWHGTALTPLPPEMLAQMDQMDGYPGGAGAGTYAQPPAQPTAAPPNYAQMPPAAPPVGVPEIPMPRVPSAVPVPQRTFQPGRRPLADEGAWGITQG